MTSYKSSHAFETLQSSRPPLKKTPTSSNTPQADQNASSSARVTSSPATMTTSSHANLSTSPAEVPSSSIDFIAARKRSNSINSALIDEPFTQPHSLAHSSVAFSSSLVREQSLALGHLEQRHSMDSPSSPTGSHSLSSPSWATAAETPSGSIRQASSVLLQQHQQSHEQPLAIRRKSVDRSKTDPQQVLLDRRSPPSGLSLLLKTNDAENNSGKGKAGTSNSNINSTAGPSGSEEQASLQKRPSTITLSPPPVRPLSHSSSTGAYAPSNINNHHNNATLPTSQSATSLNADEYDDAAIEHMLALNAKGSSGRVASFLSKLGQPFRKTTAGSTAGATGAQETDRLLPSNTNGSAGYDTVVAPSRPSNQRSNSLPGGSGQDGPESIWKEFRATRWNRKTLVQKCVVEPIGFMPAVILGLLLNLLDAVSYGMIIFPLNIAPFQALGPDGISMFFVSCVVSQLVYSLGGSAFKGGNGSMMIEVVPFLHLMAETVVGRVGAENRDEVLATTILAYALSTIMTGAVFMALGYFKLGSLIAFFPRHILVGCIGGVGWFLVITGFEVSSRMTTELTYSWETFKFLFLNAHVFALWSSAFGLALLLRLLQHKIRHPFLVPVFFMVVPGLFYTIVALAGWDWEMLRNNGWVFPMPEGNAPGWQFYSYFDLKKTSWMAILDTVPAMLALTFFGILHVPINVPALGVSTGQDNVDTNRELVAHGWSNLLSGGVGTVQNYLVYTNSLLFIKSGGDSRVAGVMLAMASLVVFFVGPWIVGYIPVMVVGSLIFHLGLDLVKEALWDTWGLVHRLEYITIALIVVAMAGFGFVEGIFLGILLACVFFVVSNSRKEGVRYSCTGESAKSTVRRVYRQQKFLRQVGRQIYIFKLQGDLFFGTIDKVEKEIQDVFSRRRWEINPIQFLVLDFSLVRGVDFSAAEGFVRIRRAVRAKGVCLVLAGLDEQGEIGKALQMVGVWGAGAGAGMGEGHGQGNFHLDGFDTQTFPGLSEALEYCENCLLETFYRTRESALEVAKRKRLLELAGQDDVNPLSPDSESTHFFSEQMQNSPRKSHLFEAARETLLVRERPFPHPINLQQPVPTLLAAFHDTRDNPTDFFLRLSMYFVRRTVLAGTILWRQGGSPTDGIYLVESGTLRSVLEFQDSGMVRRSVEVILPGTISGEIGLFTGNDRSSTLVSETDGIVWGLSQDQFQKMVKDDPALAVEFMRVAMSYSAERLNTMAAYAFSLS